nr:MAG TPA: hypothetical protein [Caudoviricetes sp.]
MRQSFNWLRKPTFHATTADESSNFMRQEV